MQLSMVEISTLASIYVFKLIIDFLGDPDAYTQNYAYMLFGAFAILRMITILSRSYYDLHVYNYFKFVQNKIQCWLFDLSCNMRQYQIGESKKAQLINILTKDIDIFVNGSW